MSRLLALELNDLDLRFAGDPGLDDLEPSLGWAVVQPEGIACGSAAAASARLHPRAAHRAIWSELSTEPLPRPFPAGVSTADLAYSHLLEVWGAARTRLGRAAGELEGVLLLAPASFSPEELGLVLSIAASLEVPLTGLVDSAVAAVASSRRNGRILHLDLELGRAVITELEAGEASTGPWLLRRRVRIEKLAGWNALLDLWTREIGRAFVGATRFDPLHAARSEQELYDRLPSWLEELSVTDSLEAVMGTSDREHRVLLTRDRVAEASGAVYGRIVEGARALILHGADGVLLVSHRVARAPGLVDRLNSAGLGKCEVLQASAASKGALANSDSIHAPGAETLPRVTRLNPLTAEHEG